MRMREERVKIREERVKAGKGGSKDGWKEE